MRTRMLVLGGFTALALALVGMCEGGEIQQFAFRGDYTATPVSTSTVVAAPTCDPFYGRFCATPPISTATVAPTATARPSVTTTPPPSGCNPYLDPTCTSPAR